MHLLGPITLGLLEWQLFIYVVSVYLFEFYIKIEVFRIAYMCYVLEIYNVLKQETQKGGGIAPTARTEPYILWLTRYRSRTYPMRWCMWSMFCKMSQIAKFIGPTWDPPGADRTQVGPKLAPWTLLSGVRFCSVLFSCGLNIRSWSLTYILYPYPLWLLHENDGNPEAFHVKFSWCEYAHCWLKS